MIFGPIHRRSFLTLLGGAAAAWPVDAKAQQRAVPAVGVLHSGSPDDGYAPGFAGFRAGLNEAGFVERQNVVIEYRWALGQFDRLPALADELVRSHVAIIVATGGVVSALAAKAATSTIPIVFAHGSDPIKFGLVASFNRPGGNITGVSFFSIELEQKRLELLHELMPNVATIAALINPNNPNAERQSKDVQAAGRALGRSVVLLNAGTERDIDAAFATLVQQKAGALTVTADSFFLSRYDQIVLLAARHRVPTIYTARGFAERGGLISYDTSFANNFRQPIQRRSFLTLLSGAAATLPVGARAQQSAMPVIGFLSSRSPDTAADLVRAFRQGLGETSFVEGRNVAIEFRWAELQNDRLPALAADLVRRQVAVIAGVSSTQGVQVAKAATATIPIVFAIGGDPVKNGLVASLNRPGGNVTGVSILTNELGPKRLGLLRDLLPNAGLILALVNPTNPNAESDAKEMLAAAQSIGMTLEVLHATNDREIDAFFATLVQRRASAFLTTSDSLFTSRRQQFAVLAAYHRIPTIYELRDYTDVGGLMSYGPNLNDAYRQAGIYTGRILKREKPADLPVMQPTKFEFVINLKTAKALGLTIPDKLLALADEVIE